MLLKSITQLTQCLIFTHVLLVFKYRQLFFSRPAQKRYSWGSSIQIWRPEQNCMIFFFNVSIHQRLFYTLNIAYWPLTEPSVRDCSSSMHLCKQDEKDAWVELEMCRHCEIIYTWVPTAVTVSFRAPVGHSRGLKSTSKWLAGVQLGQVSSRGSGP